MSLKNIRKIEDRAFQGCTSLVKVNLGNHSVNFDGPVFSDCTSLKYIVIPAGSTLGGPFGGCSMLQSIIYLGENLGKGGSNANTYSAADLVTWSGHNFTYTGVVPRPSYTNAAPAGFQVTGTSYGTLNTNAGTYTDSLAFTFANQDMSFDVKIPYSYTISVLTRQPQITTTAVLGSKVGNYPISVSGTQAKNYNITYESGVLQVQKRSLNVSTENYTRAYNEENPKFELSYQGFVNGEDENVLIAEPTVTTEATKKSDVGTYTLVVSGGMADNYNFVYSNGSLIIEKAYQTMNWDQDLDKISLYSQVELTAEASSNLPVTYQIDNDSVCNLTYIGSKTYIDCFHYGKAVISAYQAGNNNYWPTTKSYKVLTVSDPSGIKAVVIDGKLTGRIQAANSTFNLQLKGDSYSTYIFKH